MGKQTGGLIASGDGRPSGLSWADASPSRRRSLLATQTFGVCARGLPGGTGGRLRRVVRCPRRGSPPLGSSPASYHWSLGPASRFTRSVTWPPARRFQRRPPLRSRRLRHRKPRTYPRPGRPSLPGVPAPLFALRQGTESASNGCSDKFRSCRRQNHVKTGFGSFRNKTSSVASDAALSTSDPIATPAPRTRVRFSDPPPHAENSTEKLSSRSD
jgi:hypothetical protein